MRFAAPTTQARLNSNSRPAPRNEAHQEQHKENEKENFRDTRRSSGDSAEAENTRDNRDHQKDQCVVKHTIFSIAESTSR
jgi:hypothetical protein